MPGTRPSRVRDGIRHPAFDEEMPRMERVLASARFFLALAALVAIWVDPTQPRRYETLTYLLLTIYVFYSYGLFVLILLRKYDGFKRPFILGVHAVDLLWPALLSLFTEGAESLFYLFFFFVLISAAYRWGFWETLATTGAAISLLSIEAVLVGTGPADTGHILQGQFALNAFIMRITYLFLMGLLMGYLGEEQRRLRLEAAAVARIIAKAQAKRGLADTMHTIHHEILSIFGADQVNLAISETRSGRTFLWQTRPEPGQSVTTTQVSEIGSPQKETYLFPSSCQALRATRRHTAGQGDLTRIIALDSQGKRMRNRSCTFPAHMQSSAAFRSVLAVSVAFEDEWIGRLFVFKPRDGLFRERELLFLQTLIQKVAAAVYNAYLVGRLRLRAGALERARLAQELHDGVVQSLSGLALQMEAMRREVPTAPPRMLEEIERIQQGLRIEVENLRDLTRGARPLNLGSDQLLDFVRDIVNRFQFETGISTGFVSNLRDAKPPSLVCRELARITQEALVNVRKHSGARNVIVHLVSEDEFWKLVVNDDGRGFDFTGRLSHIELDALQMGPRVIKQRVAALQGALTIESRPGAGANLEISIPRQAYG